MRVYERGVSSSLALLYFLLGLMGGGRAAALIGGKVLQNGEIFCQSVRPSQPDLRPSQPGLRHSQPGLRHSQPGLRPSQPDLRPGQSGLRPIQPDLRPSQIRGSASQPAKKKGRKLGQDSVQGMGIQQWGPSNQGACKYVFSFHCIYRMALQFVINAASHSPDLT